MRKLRKVWWILGLAVVLIVGGGLGIKQYVTMKVGKSVATMAQDPTVKKAIAQAIQNGGGQQNVAALLKSAAAQTGSSIAAAAPNATAGKQAGAAPSVASTTSSSPVIGKAASGQPGSANLQFQNSNQALSFAMSKFSPTQVAQYLNAYENRNHLSAAEKSQLKEQVLSKFTANELAAIEKAMAQ